MRRHQKGSLQIRKHGGIRKYVAFYYGADGKRVCVTIGQVSKMSKGQAEAKLAELVASVNARDERDPTLAEFLAAEYLPFKRRAWKSSTASTTEQRLRTHLQEDLGKLKISELRRGMMAEYLEGKAARGLSHSLVAHLRWDFKAVLDLAVADGIVKTNQAKDLFVPKVKGVVSTKTATPQQVMAALSALDVRDRLMVRLALFVGLRPGEICALEWKHIAGDAALVEQRVYRGVVDTVKNLIPRTVALPASTVREFERWASLAMSGRWVFPTEGGGPGNRDSFWRHSIAPRLKKKGLDWLNFQVMRRTWTSLAAGAGIDPKVRADQLGHGVDVDINTYTQTDFSAKLAAVTVVEGLLNGSGSEAVQ